MASGLLAGGASKSHGSSFAILASINAARCPRISRDKSSAQHKRRTGT
jgi:hypothetical protein